MLKEFFLKFQKQGVHNNKDPSPVMYENGGGSGNKKAFRYWNTKLRSPAKEIAKHKRKLMERSEDLIKNTGIGKAILNKYLDNVLGTGLRVKPNINGKVLGISPEEKEKLETTIQFYWELWAGTHRCDYKKQNNFYELQEIAFSSWVIYGEGISILPRVKLNKRDIVSLKVDLVESRRLNRAIFPMKNVVNGVEYNDKGQLEAYHFTSRTKIGLLKTTKVVAFDKNTGHKNVLCIFSPERVGQRVGVPLITAVMEDIKQISDWQRSEVEAAKATAVNAYFITKDLGANHVKGRGQIIKGENGEEIEVQNIEPGSVTELAPGENVVAPPAGRQVGTFDEFLTSSCKIIGSGVGLPFEILLNAFNTNYSASRAAILEAWKSYLKKRSRFIENFCEPIYEQFIDEIIAREYIDAPNYFTDEKVRQAVIRSEWYGPIQGSIDPKKEAQADTINLTNGTTSRTRIAREKGIDWDKTVDQLEKEKKAMEERGLINTKKT